MVEEVWSDDLHERTEAVSAAFLFQHGIGSILERPFHSLRASFSATRTRTAKQLSTIAMMKLLMWSTKLLFVE